MSKYTNTIEMLDSLPDRVFREIKRRKVSFRRVQFESGVHAATLHKFVTDKDHKTPRQTVCKLLRWLDESVGMPKGK